MKSYKLLSIALFIASAFVGCTGDENVCSKDCRPALSLAPSVAEGKLTRICGSAFFVNDDRIAVTVTDRMGTNNYEYSYNNESFRGINTANTYYFFMDDEVISTLTAKWPATRPSVLPTDQRLDANFKLCDYMTATINNIMPTQEYVPIDFVRENSKITFVVEGQNANGQAITSLVVDVNGVGYWTHPNPINGTAELILAPGDVTLNADEIAGRITIGGYTGSVVFQMTQTYTLLANTSYTVTLTPTGDTVYATISIGGWNQHDEGMGVPLTLVNGYYMISTEAQLFAIWKLISNYTPNSGGVDWTSAKYKLGANIVRSIPLRPWSSLTNFTGEFNYNLHTISPDITFSTGGTIVNP